MLVCKRVLYSGRVQGVGFRCTAQHLAHGLAVAGYVRNLRSGQVELVAQGEDAVVDDFLRRIAERMAGCIAETDIAEEPVTQLTGFRIRHD